MDEAAMDDTTTAPINTTFSSSSSSSSSDLHRASRGGWNAAIFIIFVEMAERFAFYGLSGNLVSYLTNELHESTAAAAKNVNTWVGVSFIFPLLGAFLADSYLGRFYTIIFSSIIYFLGMVLLTLSVWVIPVHSRKAVFFTALYILSIGEGGHKPSVQTFAADQFDEESPQQRIAKASFFNCWYLGIIVGATAAVLVIIYIQDNVGWALGFGILAAVLAVAFGIFLLGIKKYRKQGPLGSPFTAVAQVLVAAVRKWRMNETQDGRGVFYGDTMVEGAMVMATQTKTFARTKHFRFLDKAMIIGDIDASNKTRDPWRLCSLNQVEETKLVLGLIPIWLASLYIYLVQAQLPTFFTKQGSTMVRSLGPNFTIPPASLQCILGFAVIIILPIYDRLFVPIARSFTGNPTGITMLQRIGIGLFLSFLTILVAALVESKRLQAASDHNLLDSPKAKVPIRVWWLLPQYILSGFSDAFAIVGLQHLFYDQMPEAMRSMGAAFYISNAGVGNFISSAIISIVEAASGGKWLESNNLNRAHLDYYYFVLAGLGILDLGVFVVVARRYVYKQIEGNVGARQEKEKEKEMMGFEGHTNQHV